MLTHLFEALLDVGILHIVNLDVPALIEPLPNIIEVLNFVLVDFDELHDGLFEFMDFHAVTVFLFVFILFGFDLLVVLGLFLVLVVGLLLGFLLEHDFLLLLPLLFEF